MAEKLDIETGAEWLLPAGRRWLAQAKRVMRTVLGSKVFDLPSGEKVTVTWRPGLDYIRIAGSSPYIVVGFTNTPDGRRAWRWASGVFNILPMLPGAISADAVDVSGDGKVVVGNSTVGAVPRPWMWSALTGIVDMNAPEGFSVVTAVSSDGLVAVGYTTAGGSGHITPWRWTATDGIVILGPIPDPTIAHIPADVSGDGSVVIGYGSGSSWRWAADTGFITFDAITIPGYPSTSISNFVPTDISYDAFTVAGYATIAEAITTVTWTPVAGYQVVELGTPYDKQPVGISRDGSTIIGTASVGGSFVYSWKLTSATGLVPHDIRSYAAMSDNAKVICGGTVLPGGVIRTFIIEGDKPPVYLNNTGNYTATSVASVSNGE